MSYSTEKTFEFIQINTCAADGFVYVSRRTAPGTHAEQYAEACMLRDSELDRGEARVDFRFYIDETGVYGDYRFRQTANPETYTKGSYVRA